jgi:hypothetical protein
LSALPKPVDDQRQLYRVTDPHGVLDDLAQTDKALVR